MPVFYAWDFESCCLPPRNVVATAYAQLQTRLASEPSTYLVTGAAGFIGMHTSLRLLAWGARLHQAQLRIVWRNPLES